MYKNWHVFVIFVIFIFSLNFLQLTAPHHPTRERGTLYDFKLQTLLRLMFQLLTSLTRLMTSSSLHHVQSPVTVWDFTLVLDLKHPEEKTPTSKRLKNPNPEDPDVKTADLKNLLYRIHVLQSTSQNPASVRNLKQIHKCRKQSDKPQLFSRWGSHSADSFLLNCSRTVMLTFSNLHCWLVDAGSHEFMKIRLSDESLSTQLLLTGWKRV